MIKAIIGLGNPGPHYYKTRHSIGFQIVDALASEYNAHFSEQNEKEVCEIHIDDHACFLIKPLTFMNSSGRIVPWLLKKGIKPEEILVVHDELEFPFGKLGLRLGGSARGHNGLKSIIAVCGDNFWRFRFGIGRPEDRREVPDYVLKPFCESEVEVNRLIDDSVVLIQKKVVE